MPKSYHALFAHIVYLSPKEYIMKILNKLIRNIAKRWAIKHKSAIAHKTSTDPIKYYTEQIRTTSNNHAEKSSNNNLQPDSAMKYQLKVINRPNHVPLLNDGSHRHTRIRSEKTFYLSNLLSFYKFKCMRPGFHQHDVQPFRYGNTHGSIFGLAFFQHKSLYRIHRIRNTGR